MSIEDYIKELEIQIESLPDIIDSKLLYVQISTTNQIDNIVHGSSRKFPCQTEEEKLNSLKSISGFLKIIVAAHNS